MSEHSKTCAIHRPSITNAVIRYFVTIAASLLTSRIGRRSILLLLPTPVGILHHLLRYYFRAAVGTIAGTAIEAQPLADAFLMKDVPAHSQGGGPVACIDIVQAYGA